MKGNDVEQDRREALTDWIEHEAEGIRQYLAGKDEEDQIAWLSKADRELHKRAAGYTGPALDRTEAIRYLAIQQCLGEIREARRRREIAAIEAMIAAYKKSG